MTEFDDHDDDLPTDEPSEEDGEGAGRTNRMLRFARRLVDRKELAEDTKDLLYAVLSTSDKAKTEAVKMVGREVRHYLDELKIKEDLLHLMTSYSLEVSIHLKPLADAVRGDPEADQPEAADATDTQESPPQ